MIKILIIEDNLDLALGLESNLQLEGYCLQKCHDGAHALRAIKNFIPHLIVLDMMLPNKDGFQIIQEMQKLVQKPLVLCLTARAEEIDKVRALRSGADDYLTKPFGLMEFLARIEALLRRTKNSHNDTLNLFDLCINQPSKTVTKNNKSIDLTPKEYQLLVYLLKNKNTVQSRHQIMKHVWGHLSKINSRTVDTHIAELRKKLENDPHHPQFIITVAKFGYSIQSYLRT